MTAVFAECNRLPFDLPEAEQELVGGYHTEYSSSMKLGLFLMGEYVHMLTTSFLMAIVFLGGWHFPGISEVGGLLGVILKFIVVAVKVGFFIMLGVHGFAPKTDVNAPEAHSAIEAPREGLRPEGASHGS